MWPRLLATLLFVAVVVANDWCRPEHDCIQGWPRKRIQHTVCVYDEIPAECESNYGWQHWFSDEEKAIVLDVHNRLRSAIARGFKGQPPAADMMRLEWDDEVELVAQKWASQCNVDGHDKCRESWKKEGMGQNYAWAGGSTSENAPPRFPDVDYSVRDWVCKEVTNMKQEYILRYPTNSLYLDIGHYTQVAWARATHLGCGIAHKTLKSGYLTNWEYKLICNYMIQGNLEGAPVYTIGPAASKCPQGTGPSQKYPGLCEYPRKYKDFSDKLKSLKDLSRSNTSAQKSQPQGYPVEQPKTASSKPPTQQLPKTNPKPVSQQASNSWSSWLNYDLSQLPLVGRFFEPLKPAGKPTNTPTKPAHTQPQPTRGSQASPTNSRPALAPSQSAPSPGKDAGDNSPDSICTYLEEQKQRQKQSGGSGPLFTFSMRPALDDDLPERMQFPMMRVTSDPFADMRQRHEEFANRMFQEHTDFIQNVNAMHGGHLPDMTDHPFFSRSPFSRKK